MHPSHQSPTAEPASKTRPFESAPPALRIIVADDEPLARERLRRLLGDEKGLEIVAECDGAESTVAAISKLRPDLVFLDVSMPDGDGFEVIRRVGSARMPGVIFVTAHGEYALDAFEVHAIDYLLKPFDRRRFRRALESARRRLGRLQTGSWTPGLVTALDEIARRGAYSDRFAVKSRDRIVFVKVEEIDWIDAAGNYVLLNTARGSHRLRETMGGIEARLDPVRFLRIHRSTIVNLARVSELQPLRSGENVVILENGRRLILSRGYRDRLPKILGP